MYYVLTHTHATTQVGILDVDLCGPSIPQMLGLTDCNVHQSSSGYVCYNEREKDTLGQAK